MYADPLSIVNDEIFFIEVKRPGKYNNGHLESNLVKLDKEIQIALNKSILRKVASPEVVGLLIKGNFIFDIVVLSLKHLA